MKYLLSYSLNFIEKLAGHKKHFSSGKPVKRRPCLLKVNVHPNLSIYIYMK